MIYRVVSRAQIIIVSSFSVPTSFVNRFDKGCSGEPQSFSKPASSLDFLIRIVILWGRIDPIRHHSTHLNEDQDVSGFGWLHDAHWRVLHRSTHLWRYTEEFFMTSSLVRWMQLSVLLSGSRVSELIKDFTWRIRIRCIGHWCHKPLCSMTFDSVIWRCDLVDLTRSTSLQTHFNAARHQNGAQTSASVIKWWNRRGDCSSCDRSGYHATCRTTKQRKYWSSDCLQPKRLS